MQPNDMQCQLHTPWARANVRRLTLAVSIAMLPVVQAARMPDDGASQRAGGTPSFDVAEKTMLELQTAMETGTVSSRGLVEQYLARIAAYDRNGPRLNAMISLNRQALETAEALDRERAASGPRGPLHGIPIVIKDNFNTVDMPTTAGSVALAGFQPRADAFQVRKLREAGAVVIGKTNLHELAMGITTVSSLGGQTRNPYDPLRSPGGSSGGTGAAVAASFAAAGMGSDTCGSIRIPAANNNLFGMRGTLGLSSRHGIIPLSSTQDVGGPLARTVTDLALMLDATVGFDPADTVTRLSEGHVPATYRDALRPDGLKGARIGVLLQLFGDAPEDEEVTAVVRKALDAMKAQGAETIDIRIPGLEELVRDSGVIDAEFKFDFIDFMAAVPDAPVRSPGDILERGLYHSAIDTSLKRRNTPERRDTDDYRRALIRRRALSQLVLAAMEERRLDALAYPTLRRRPATIGEPQRGSNCQLSAHTGLPALSLPAGFTEDGVPVGMDLVGGYFTEPALLRLAYGFEQAARPRRAPFTTPALVDGKMPGSIGFDVSATGAGVVPPSSSAITVKGRFTVDAPTGRLSYLLNVAGTPPGDLATLAIHRGGAKATGPALFVLDPATGPALSGTVTLSARDYEDLRAGDLYLQVYTRAEPNGAARAQLAVP